MTEEKFFDLGTALRANQQLPPPPRARDDPSSDEDCLYLNVWTPACAIPTSAAPPSYSHEDNNNHDGNGEKATCSLNSSSSTSNSSSLGASLVPVMVWIHGGSFQYGATSDPMYDGASLAVNADMVVVSVAYRLGPF